jgi:hypothetical protein
MTVSTRVDHRKLSMEIGMIKKFLAGLGIALITTGAWASCSTHTITSGGRMVTCTTCCFGNNCTTNCF